MTRMDKSKTDGETKDVWANMWKDKLVTFIHIAEKFKLSMTKHYKNIYNTRYMELFEKSNDFKLLKLANEFLSIADENETKPISGMKK